MIDPNGFPPIEPATDEEALRQRRLQAGANLRILLGEIDVDEGVQALRQSEEDGNPDAMNAFADRMKRLGNYE